MLKTLAPSDSGMCASAQLDVSINIYFHGSNEGKYLIIAHFFQIVIWQVLLDLHYQCFHHIFVIGWSELFFFCCLNCNTVSTIFLGAVT